MPLLALRSLYTPSLGTTQPAGLGGTIYIYDNTLSANGSFYTFAEIATAYPADFEELGLGNRQYRSHVDVQVGDLGTGTAPTTLQESSTSISFDPGKALLTRSTQTSSWSIIFGTKVGTGNVASGKNGVNMFFSNVSGTKNIAWRGTVKLYGCSITARVTGGTMALQFPLQVASASDFVNNIFNGFSSYVLGSSGAPIFNVYNLDITSDGASSNITAFFVDNADLMTVGGNPAGAYIASATPNIAFKRCKFFGTPGQSDLRWNAGANNWKVVQPQWSGNAARFSGTGNASADLGSHEYWGFGPKVVLPSGAGASGIPVKLTDVLANVMVNTTTDANGRVTFDSGISLDNVIVRDHYGSAGYLTRDRSPFTVEYNMGAGRNTAYKGKTYQMDWPGIESGNFENVDDILPLEPADGPTASFSANATGGDAPLTVNFTDESDPGDEPITSWAWTFGDGGTSTAQNPTYIYNTPGTYNVTLTVTTALGSDPLTRSGYVNVETTGAPPPPPGPPITTEAPVNAGEIRFTLTLPLVN